ncbi:MAG: hypothetical protein ACRC5H_05875 [Treponemataceae bacterium]
MKKTASILFLIIMFFSSILSVSSQIQTSTAEGGFSQEEFRRGIQAYYRGSFNDAIVLLERALSYMPNESLILDWLGNAYFRSGIEGTALQYWDLALQNGYGGTFLQSKIDLLRDRRIPSSNLLTDIRFVEAGSFQGKIEQQFYFSQPIASLPLQNGHYWVLAYGSNELLQFDINGNILFRSRGPINGFDRPLDILEQSNGQLIISEFAGDRLSLLTPEGAFIRYIGSRGINDGELLGPQFLAKDSSDNIFVTDFGNARVVIFDNQGEPLFSFGNKTAFFNGFIAPTGIAIIDDIVYVGDAVYGTIFMFDTAGNYIDNLLPEKSFQRPESMKVWNDYLLVADSNRVFATNISEGTITEISNTGNGLSRITSANADINGNLVVTDFKSNEVYIMSKVSELISGFFVQVDKIISDSFPQVTIELRVESKDGTPIVGLQNDNFLLTEKRQNVTNQQLSASAFYNEVCDITILVDRSLTMDRYTTQIQSTIQEIASLMKGRGTIRVVSAGSIPAVEIAGSPQQLLSFNTSQLKTQYAEVVALDDAIRLAGNVLMQGEKKRSIIFLTNNEVSPFSFSKYGLVDISSFLYNNNIGFITISLNYDQFSAEVEYLTKNTVGKQYFIYRPEGIKSIINDIIATPIGVYQLSYTSNLPTDFGRAFLPVEIELYLHNRSGRAETAYFPPLE